MDQSKCGMDIVHQTLPVKSGRYHLLKFSNRRPKHRCSSRRKVQFKSSRFWGTVLHLPGNQIFHHSWTQSTVTCKLSRLEPIACLGPVSSKIYNIPCIKDMPTPYQLLVVEPTPPYQINGMFHPRIPFTHITEVNNKPTTNLKTSL